MALNWSKNKELSQALIVVGRRTYWNSNNQPSKQWRGKNIYIRIEDHRRGVNLEYTVSYCIISSHWYFPQWCLRHRSTAKHPVQLNFELQQDWFLLYLESEWVLLRGTSYTYFIQHYDLLIFVYTIIMFALSNCISD